MLSTEHNFVSNCQYMWPPYSQFMKIVLDENYYSKNAEKLRVFNHLRLSYHAYLNCYKVAVKQRPNNNIYVVQVINQQNMRKVCVTV